MFLERRRLYGNGNTACHIGTAGYRLRSGNHRILSWGGNQLCPNHVQVRNDCCASGVHHRFAGKYILTKKEDSYEKYGSSYIFKGGYYEILVVKESRYSR